MGISLTKRIYDFLFSKVKSKFIVLKIIKESKNGYFFEYFADQSLIKFLNEKICEKIILKDQKKML